MSENTSRYAQAFAYVVFEKHLDRRETSQELALFADLILNPDRA